jgi:hypothetical protein
MNDAVQPSCPPRTGGEYSLVKSLSENPPLTIFGSTEEAPRNQAKIDPAAGARQIRHPPHVTTMDPL